MTTPQLTPWFYVADPAELPAPHELEHPPCMADPAARYTPRGLLVPRTCCWYHQGSWDEASRVAVALTLAAQAEGVPASAKRPDRQGIRSRADRAGMAPQYGEVVAKFPPSRTNRWWLRGPVSIRSPQLDGEWWYLPRSCLTRLVNAAIDRYGYIALWRDMSKLSHCNKACLEATGLDCDCSCMGVFHGEGAQLVRTHRRRHGRRPR